MKRFIIGGIPRCGTTLLANLLHAQQGCTVVTAYLDAFDELADTLQVCFDEPLDADRRRVALLKVREQMLLLRHALLTAPDEFETLDELHRLALASVARAEGQVVGHKALLSPPRIERLLATTDVRVVVVLRDPRDAAVSWWYRTGTPVVRYLEDWKRMVRFVQRTKHHRLHVIRFEALVSDPAESLRALLHDMGLVFRLPTALVAFRDAREGTAAWRPNTAHTDVTRLLDPSAVGRWRSTSRSAAVRYAGWVCRREIEALGYPPMEPASPSEVARFFAARIANQASAALRHSADVIQRCAPHLHHSG